MISRLISIFRRVEQPPVYPDTEDFVGHIAGLVHQGNIELAVHRVAAFQSDHPHEKKILCNAAIRISEGGHPNIAIPIFLQIVSDNPNDSVLIGNLAGAYTNDSQYELALKTIEQSLTIDPDDPNTNRIHGNILVKLERFKCARDACCSFLKKHPNDLDSHFRLGWLEVQDDHYELAIKHFKTVLELDPDHFKALSNIGGSLIALDRLSEAEDVVLKALKMNPNNGVSICNLARLYEKQNRPEEAYKLYQRSLQQDPHYTKAMDDLEHLALQLNIPNTKDSSTDI